MFTFFDFKISLSIRRFWHSLLSSARIPPLFKDRVGSIRKYLSYHIDPWHRFVHDSCSIWFVILSLILFLNSPYINIQLQSNFRMTVMCSHNGYFDCCWCLVIVHKLFNYFSVNLELDTYRAVCLLNKAFKPLFYLIVFMYFINSSICLPENMIIFNFLYSHLLILRWLITKTTIVIGFRIHISTYL